MSGIMSFTGERPDGPPVKCGAPLSDITAGILAAMGILAAYTHRLKTGEGQWVETSLVRGRAGPDLLASGHRARHRRGAESDGLGASAQCALSGVRSLRQVDRGRRRQQETLAAHARSAWRDGTRAGSALCNRCRPDGASEGTGSRADRAFRKRTPAILAGALEEVGVPCGPVNDMLQALADPQTIAREMVVEVEHSTLGKVKTMGLPIKFRRRRARCDRRAAYGEHTRSSEAVWLRRRRNCSASGQTRRYRRTACGRRGR